MIGRTRSISIRRYGAAALVAASLAAAVPEAAAAPDKTPASALERFEAAQKLFDQKRYAEALTLFRKVHEESASPNAHLMVGRCLLALGKTTEAYDELSATVKEA